MNYDNFYCEWDAALRAAGLISSAERPENSIDLGTMTRTYRVLIRAFRKQMAEPFTTSMELSWRWDALLSARTCTTEEDTLTELLGRQAAERSRTEQPWLRVDIKLHGKLAWDKPLRLASADIWRAWKAEVESRVDPRVLSPTNRDAAGLEGVRAWRGEPEAHTRVTGDGELWLLGVELAAWNAIVLPRQLDDLDAVQDEAPQKQLETLSERLSAALNAWTTSLKLLLPEERLFH